MTTITEKNREKGQGPAIVYPAEYQIHILGKLDISWSDRLAGMSITTTGGRNVAAQTTLQGELVDQSALLGVLNTLHDLGYTLVRVNYLSNRNH